MGVPAFYRWLSEKYPKIVADVVEQRCKVVDNIAIPIDLQEPNPNGVEYDNLYVDMNGLIHPCSHPEDRDAPATEEEMYANITKYVDRLFAVVRPRRLLYLAIDGVAPRAKMNQQRSRRFRAAQEVRERDAILHDVVAEMASVGIEVPAKTSSWDSNVITPGTEFMHNLSTYIWFYILERINSNPSWRKIKVIFSDASVPGEGEHKIMEFIRAQRTQPGFDPNQSHILHGLDADLIMLALATHEARFSILREEVVFGRRDKEPGTFAQKLLDERTGSSAAGASSVNAMDEWVFSKRLQVLDVAVLREYLASEFSLLSLDRSLPFPFDFERAVDDFVFMCFFVGNDFLPHLPSLDIRDGALDFLIETYKTVLPALGDFLTSPGGEVNLPQVDILLSRVSEIESEVFVRRQRSEGDQSRRAPARKPSGGTEDARVKIEEERSKMNADAAKELKKSLLGKRRPSEPADDTDAPADADDEDATMEDEEEEELEKAVRVVVKAMPTFEELQSTKAEIERRIKDKQHVKIEGNKSKVKDQVKFHESGYKERYYSDDFKRRDVEEGGGLARMCETYVQGLCWVLKYYYAGCPSWQWYYPFHYAPFASDLVNVDAFDVEFELSQPFNPTMQLLAVLPSDSAHALPGPCKWLMLEPESPIYDLYDQDVPLDPNGKHLPWLWVLLLPFIDETRIISAFDACEGSLSEEDRARNAFGCPLMLFHRDSSLAVHVAQELEYGCRQMLGEGALEFSGEQGGGIAGKLSRVDLRWFSPLERAIDCPYTEIKFSGNIARNQAMSLEFALLPSLKTHESRLLEGVVPPKPKLGLSDIGLNKFPRLNKKFNIVDMVLNRKNSNSIYDTSIKGGSLAQSMQQSGGYRASGLQQNPMAYAPAGGYSQRLPAPVAGYPQHGYGAAYPPRSQQQFAQPMSGYGSSGYAGSHLPAQFAQPYAQQSYGYAAPPMPLRQYEQFSYQYQDRAAPQSSVPSSYGQPFYGQPPNYGQQPSYAQAPSFGSAPGYSGMRPGEYRPQTYAPTAYPAQVRDRHSSQLAFVYSLLCSRTSSQRLRSRALPPVTLSQRESRCSGCRQWPPWKRCARSYCRACPTRRPLRRESPPPRTQSQSLWPTIPRKIRAGGSDEC